MPTSILIGVGVVVVETEVSAAGSAPPLPPEVVSSPLATTGARSLAFLTARPHSFAVDPP